MINTERFFVEHVRVEYMLYTCPPQTSNVTTTMPSLRRTTALMYTHAVAVTATAMKTCYMTRCSTRSRRSSECRCTNDWNRFALARTHARVVCCVYMMCLLQTKQLHFK